MIGQELNQQMIHILMTRIVIGANAKMMMSITGKKCINLKPKF
jgi:hypothetical protein